MSNEWEMKIFFISRVKHVDEYSENRHLYEFNHLAEKKLIL